MVLQKLQLLCKGILDVTPFQVGGQHEAQLKMLEILGDGDQTELSYLLSNVSRQPRRS